MVDLSFYPISPQLETVELTIGGEPRRFEAPLTVSALIDQLSLAGRRIAVELNGEIVPRSRFDTTLIASGDAMEIVTAVGGG